MKWVLGSAWMACIITVLVRLKIYKVQYDRALARQAAENENPQPSETSKTTPP
jgi:hypothetical protein